ncbi:Gfo/Idh/MocA family protein [Paenibacillus beijingensis]|uniref:Dehydrogenase n=1 Tax=Paenibacillus beijingensis TaxID=1126833 RepID=A0A0D5NLN0_9BACL|nr:Gfo/Idh/MocA family oxidoreductase [Paenibacillus beijingensis]AJY75912.1 dehydrogenase [Paenibacillus beijingensis]
MNKLKVAVIGCGAISRLRHIPEYAANPNVEIVAFCDPNIERAKQYAETYKGRAYSDYETMLKQEHPDAVSVCTPNSLHARTAIAVAEAGAHVLVEKPIASTEAEALAMIDAARAKGVYLMVAQNQRMMPEHVRAKELVDSGRLGKVLTFRTSFGYSGPENWSVEGNGTWFYSKDKAIMGVTADLGVHKADLIRWLLNDEVSEVASFVGTIHKGGTDLDDNAICILRMKGGAMGSLAASWTYYGEADNSTVLYCENGVMKVGTHPEDQIILEMRDGTVERYRADDIATNAGQQSSGIIDAFIDSILTQTPPPIPGEEGLRSLKVVLAAFESQTSGKIVRMT